MRISPANARSHSRLELVGGDRRQEADAAVVDAEHRDAGTEVAREGLEHHPVAAEHDDEIGAGLVAVDHRRRPLPAATARTRSDASSAPSRTTSADRANRRHRRSTVRARLAGCGWSRWTRWRTYSWFPLGPGSPESTTPRSSAPSAASASTTSRTTRRRTALSRTTPFGASARPASNCGLTSTSACQPGAASAERGRQRELDRDERDVAGDELRRERQLGQRACVHSLEHDDAVVAADLVVQLAVADVERDHARRAALQEDVREPAGRRTDVEAVEAGDVEARTRRARSRACAPRGRRTAAARRRAARPTRRAARPASCDRGRDPAMTSA